VKTKGVIGMRPGCLFWLVTLSINGLGLLAFHAAVGLQPRGLPPATVVALANGFVIPEICPDCGAGTRDGVTISDGVFDDLTGCAIALRACGKCETVRVVFWWTPTAWQSVPIKQLGYEQFWKTQEAFSDAVEAASRSEICDEFEWLRTYSGVSR